MLQSLWWERLAWKQYDHWGDGVELLDRTEEKDRQSWAGSRAASRGLFPPAKGSRPKAPIAIPNQLHQQKTELKHKSPWGYFSSSNVTPTSALGGWTVKRPQEQSVKMLRERKPSAHTGTAAWGYFKKVAVVLN